MSSYTKDCFRNKFDFAVSVVKKARKEILAKKDSFSYKEKTSHRDLVTNVDTYIEEFISQNIIQKYPKDSILGEEQDTYYKSHAKAEWILDPIDGTTNFIHKGKDFAISLAYYENKKEVFGIVLDVTKGDLFTAITGEGAYFNNKKLKMVEEKSIKESLIITSHRWIIGGQLSDYLDELNNCRNFRYYGVASLEICYVALGLASVYISSHIYPWDYAAARIIAQEVGLDVYDFNGEELSGFEEGEVVVTTKKLYQKIFLS